MKMVIILGILFVLGVQPLSMISIFISIVLMFTGMIYFYLGDMWLGYILMLVILSGLMVIFTYMMSLMPNESFEVSNIWFMMFISVSVGLLMKDNFINKSVFYSFSLWDGYLGGFIAFIIIFLFVVMLMVTWLSEVRMGAICVM